MNKLKLGLLAVVLIVTMFLTSFPAVASSPIKVLLNGNYLSFDVPPDNISGRTMVPMRTIFEALGASVQWDGSSNTITAIKDNTIVQATIGYTLINVNGNRTQMDIAPVIINGRTLVPVRFISEAFGCDVTWDGLTNTVLISSQNSYEQIQPQDNDFDEYDFWGEDGEVEYEDY